MVVGLVGLVSVTAASDTVKATVELRALLSGGPVSTFTATGPEGFIGRRVAETYRTSLLRHPVYEQVAIRIDARGANFQVHETDAHADVMFVSPELIAIRRFPVLEGSWLERGSLPGIVVNRALAATSGAEIRDGVRLTLGGRAEVIGVTGIIDDGTTAPAAYLSAARADLLAQTGASSAVTLEMSGPSLDAARVRDDLARLSTLRGDGQTWSVERQDSVRNVADQVRVTQTTFLIVGGLGMLGTTLGVMNVSASALRERASEMALRRAIGARPWEIAVVLMLESQIIALVASALAIPISIASYPGIAAAFSAPYGVSPPEYPWATVWLALGVGATTALVGSLLPAIRGARVSMAQVMRE